MATSKGLTLYRKFNESIVLDSHIVLTPHYIVSKFSVGENIYELQFIADWNNVSNTIRQDAGWGWVLTKDYFNDTQACLALKSMLDIADELYDDTGLFLILQANSGCNIPVSTNLIAPKLISNSAFCLLYDEDTDQELELLLDFGVPQTIYFGGLKAEIINDGFRGTHGVALTINAGQEHSIVRQELINKKRGPR